jgi:cephalosporin hydroxylase
MPEVSGRDFATFFKPDQLGAYLDGTMSYRYRGVPCLKNPLDLAIYMTLLWDAKPRTIFEIGSRAGGSALLFSDIGRTYRLDAEIVSIDLDPPPLTLEGVLFCQGDVHELGAAFERNDLYSRSRPWLVVEDSAHTFSACSAALQFFARHLRSGEYLVIEDGVIDDLGTSERYGGGPNRAIAEFFRNEPDVFEISPYCDMFGRNATFNPNAYLRKIGGESMSAFE